MKCNYLTIEREYGSGGTKIARRLAEECGLPCYGVEILEAVSHAIHVPAEQIERYEETVSNSFLYTLFMISRADNDKSDMLNREGHIYVEEQAQIRRLADQSRAIFLGHCASEALKERKGVIKVFIRAGEEDKKKRIMEDYHIPENKLESVRKRFDAKRAKYYYANTAKRWNDLNNYDIVLNSSQLGLEGCVELLKGLLLQK